MASKRVGRFFMLAGGDGMIVNWADTLVEADNDSFQGATERPPVRPPLEPERKSPPVGPPKRGPKPEPINDPPMPPSPGTDPNQEPLPIGDPPDKSDQSIRMGLVTTGSFMKWPMDYSISGAKVFLMKRNGHKVCIPIELGERSSLCRF